LLSYAVMWSSPSRTQRANQAAPLPDKFSEMMLLSYAVM